MKRNLNRTSTLLFLAFMLVLNLAMVAQEDQAARKSKHLKDLEALQQKRDSTLEAIGRMGLSELVAQMNKDSRNREHFNSPAYREVVHRRRGQGQALFDIIGQMKDVAYIPLMALRRIDMEVYLKTDSELRLKALIEAFRQTKMYNRWGVPHLYWQAPAKSMIELGKVAEDSLKLFLKDTSQADIFGYEEELEVQAYNYRKCDYALAMILASRGQGVKDLPQRPSERDRIIEQILEEKEE